MTKGPNKTPREGLFWPGLEFLPVNRVTFWDSWPALALLSLLREESGPVTPAGRGESGPVTPAGRGESGLFSPRGEGGIRVILTPREGGGGPGGAGGTRRCRRDQAVQGGVPWCTLGGCTGPGYILLPVHFLPCPGYTASSCYPAVARRTVSGLFLDRANPPVDRTGLS